MHFSNQTPLDEGFRKAGNGKSLANFDITLPDRSADALAGAARVVFENQTGAAIDKGPGEIAITWSRTALGT